MSLSAIRTNILAKLTAMGSLKSATDYEANELISYPAATLTVRAGEGEFASVVKNRRMRGFRVRIYQERTGSGFSPEKAEDILVSVLDELETAFDNDTTLSGACKFVSAIDWEALYEDRELDLRLGEIRIDAIELVDAK